MTNVEQNSRAGPKPDWLRSKIGGGPAVARLRDIVSRRNLHTVCEEALCPNMGRCWENGRATLMILGDVCTRGCSFCGVATGSPASCDGAEPGLVADAVKEMGLTDVVLTSVTRDDLDDGGAGIWSSTIRAVHAAVPEIRIEALIPDFRGSYGALKMVMDSGPEVLAHNLETVSSLYDTARPQADYGQSIELLKRCSEYGLIVKTGIMVGLGETREQILELMGDAVDAGCDIFYIGQYLQPSKRHLPVERYVEPGEFDFLRERALVLGFSVVVAGPLVRSSFHSEEQSAFVRERVDNI